MTPEEARQRAQRTADELLIAEAEMAAAGWRFITVDGLTVESEADLDLYEQVLSAFDEAASGRQGRHASTSSRLTLGIRGEDAEDRIMAQARLAELNPPGAWGASRWEVRDGLR
jgi:hypothetical protein